MADCLGLKIMTLRSQLEIYYSNQTPCKPMQALAPLRQYLLVRAPVDVDSCTHASKHANTVEQCC